jgi:dinuclear metal center YbgI/SA1388 family protein
VIKRAELSSYLNEYLNCDSFKDYAPNGLQVEGKDDIKVICSAVTASEEVIAIAAEKKADALLVHHGFFWRGEAPQLVGMKKRRVAKLLSSDMNLFGYHLPLDCHPKLGNNACIAKLLGMQSVKSHKAGNTTDLLWSGKLKKAMTVEDFAALVAKNLHREPLVVSGSKDNIQNIAWCTGGAQDFIIEANDLNVDAYLSGEISERTYYQAKELGLHYFSCGHHATERYGIQALGEHLSKRFKLDHSFIDVDNPV